MSQALPYSEHESTDSADKEREIGTRISHGYSAVLEKLYHYQCPEGQRVVHETFIVTISGSAIYENSFRFDLVEDTSSFYTIFSTRSGFFIVQHA